MQGTTISTLYVRGIWLDRGLPEDLLKEHRERCVRIPMIDSIRSLNLSNSAAIGVYEALRQRGFAGFRTEGVFPE